MSRELLFCSLGMLLCVTAIHSRAQAASFDCAKAITTREKLICSDRNLSDLDTRLGRVYKERRALLGRNGVEQLRRSQSSWIGFIDIVCPLEAPERAIRSQPRVKCLDAQYRKRLDQLSKVGQKLGSFVFNRIDLYAAYPAPVSDSTGDMPGFYIRHVAYPQIDNVETPITAAWNKNAEELVSDGECGLDQHYESDCGADYEIGYASDDLISTVWIYDVYGHGAAHGSFWGHVDNRLLRAALPVLKPSDVFGPDDHWVAGFQRLVSNALREQQWSPPDGETETALLTSSLDPGKWAFGAQGIRIVFNAYEGGCYACAPREAVELSWAELGPLLARDLILSRRFGESGGR
ncbi:DUF1311 domain-containing protein [Methylosinus sporium]|uniref:DUF1311 domain-containing protein n=2 Tax=Methylosinus sporium TaxID=428 RepID=A0A549SUS0_METSR|nr:DUF1311 domain-containing protein [Methylosinus sporium]